jgi:maltose alpha-D-glucosyltransferase/alpha-amylase
VVAVVGEGEVLFDAAADPALSRAMLEAILAQGLLRGRAGALVATLSPALAERASAPGPTEEPPPPSGRAFVAFGERFALWSSRRLDEGTSPGLELSRFLATCPSPPRVPALAAAIEYQGSTLAVLRAFVAGEGDGRAHAMDDLARFFERALARAPEAPAPALPAFHPLHLAGEELPAPAHGTMGTYLDTATLIGRRTAELHLALTSSRADAAFAPEPYTPFDQRAAYQALRTLAGRCLRRLRGRLSSLDPAARAAAERLLAGEGRILARLGALLSRRLTAQRARHHGAYQLGRLLVAGNEVVIADLDGDPARPAAERRRKASPLRDVAAMVASFHEAAFAALGDPARVRPEDVEAARPWADLWWWSAASTFVGAYLGAAGEGGFLPRGREELGELLDAFLFESGFGALADALEGRGSAGTALSFLDRLAG